MRACVCGGAGAETGGEGGLRVHYAGALLAQLGVRGRDAEDRVQRPPPRPHRPHRRRRVLARLRLLVLQELHQEAVLDLQGGVEGSGVNQGSK